MDKKLIMAAIAAGLSSDTNTQEYRIGTGSTSNKYTPHQGKQECARRLRRGSASWHSGK